MNIQKLFLAAAWLIVAPAFAADAGPPVSEWRPPVPADANAPPALDTPHLYTERLHERWLPSSINWRAPREFAINMMCDLGLLTLALMDCHDLADSGTVTGQPARGVLFLLPVAPVSPGSGSGGPDFRDLRRRPIEERMQSI